MLENAEEIMRRHEAGEGFPEIAPDYDMTPETMWAALKKAGYPVADRSTSKSRKFDQDADQYVGRWLEGQTIGQISRGLKVDPKTVRKRLVEAGVYDAKRDGKGRYRHGYSDATPFEFIEVWQTSVNVAEVTQRLNITPKVACSRAAHYRMEGVPLKKMSRGYDWKGMAEFADLFLPTEENAP